MCLYGCSKVYFGICFVVCYDEYSALCYVVVCGIAACIVLLFVDRDVVIWCIAHVLTCCGRGMYPEMYVFGCFDGNFYSLCCLAHVWIVKKSYKTPGVFIHDTNDSISSCSHRRGWRPGTAC